MKDINTHSKNWCRQNSGYKLAFVLPAFISVFVMNVWMYSALVSLIFMGMTVSLTEVSLSKLVKIYAIPVLFLTLACAPLLVSFNMGNSGIGLFSWNKNEVQRIVLISTRSFAMFTVSLFVVYSFSISESTRIFKKMRVPIVFADLFLLTYKFIVALTEESRLMLNAQKCRLAYQSGGGQLRQFSMLITAIFRNAIMQVKYLDQSLAARNGLDELTFISPIHTDSKPNWVLPILFNLTLIISFITIQLYGKV